jgi:hypothetical protein
VVLKEKQVSSFAAEMACKRKHSKYSSIISSDYIFKGLALETLGLWCKEAIDLINVIGNRLIIPFRGDFPCHSTWKRCKHSGHFSRFRIIIGNFCIVKLKCYVLMLLYKFCWTYLLIWRSLKVALNSSIISK